MENLVLAYLGDAAYELYIREYLINKGITNVNKLQKMSIKYVSASSQRIIFEKLYDIFTEEEILIYKRGRNSKGHKSKNTDIVTYKIATGFECLLGYLYINDKERFNYVMLKVVGDL